MLLGLLLMICNFISVTTSLLFILVGSSFQFMDYRLLEFFLPRLRLLLVGYYPNDSKGFFSLRNLQTFIHETVPPTSKGNISTSGFGFVMISLGIVGLVVTYCLILSVFHRSNHLGKIALAITAAIPLIGIICIGVMYSTLSRFQDVAKEAIVTLLNNIDTKPRYFALEMLKEMELRLSCCGNFDIPGQKYNSSMYPMWNGNNVYVKTNCLTVPDRCCRRNPFNNDISSKICYARGCSKILARIIESTWSLLMLLLGIPTCIQVFVLLTSNLIVLMVPIETLIVLPHDELRKHLFSNRPETETADNGTAKKSKVVSN